MSMKRQRKQACVWSEGGPELGKGATCLGNAHTTIRAEGLAAPWSAECSGKAGSCPKVELPVTSLGFCQNQCRVDSQCSSQLQSAAIVGRCLTSHLSSEFQPIQLKKWSGLFAWPYLAPVQLPCPLSGLCTPSCADHSLLFQP